MKTLAIGCVVLSMLIPAAVFAGANQIGNAGLTLFAVVLIVAGAGYAALVVKKGV